MIRNLGKALTILARAEAAELDAHADVDAFNAPSECHDLVSRHEARRMRRARKHAEAVAQRPARCIMREARRRGSVESHTSNRFYGRLVAALLTHPYHVVH